jgi:hypothetical protein
VTFISLHSYWNVIVTQTDGTSWLQELNVAYTIGAVCNVLLLLHLIYFCLVWRKRQSAFSMVTTLQMDIRGISVRFPEDIIPTSVKRMSAIKAHQTVSQRVQGVTSPKVKRPGREADHSTSIYCQG